MALLVFIRVLFAFLLLLVVIADDNYKIPDVTIQAFTPKGLRATIPDADNLVIFAIQGIVTHGATKTDVGGESVTKIGNNWVVDLLEITLAVNDEIDYLAFVGINTDGYIKDQLRFKVEKLLPYVALDESIQETVGSLCEPTATRVRQGTVCKDDVIFEENFDTLRKEIWQVQKYAPVKHPELPFVTYMPSAVSITNDGYLRIHPEPHANTSVYKDLDLYNGCTAEEPESCYVSTNHGAAIIPPVVSGRIISKPGFAFTFGIVSIRAKFPQGDWIYPEILLESLLKKFAYGTTNSGLLKIASSRGNKELARGSTVYGNKVLYSGPVVDTVCHGDLIVNKVSDKFWSDDFHVYSAKWTPDEFTMYVDEVEYASVEKGFRERLSSICPNEKRPGMEPFDDLFYITLGLAVGGHTEFPDESITTGHHKKPWKNLGSKATFDFWQDKKAWYDTWKAPELLVDYIRVKAL